MIVLSISGGVMIETAITITTMECLRYFLRNATDTTSTLAKKYKTKGNWKAKPEPSISGTMVLK